MHPNNHGTLFGPDLPELKARLERYGVARNRYDDRETRLITITDDEALTLVSFYGAVIEEIARQS